MPQTFRSEELAAKLKPLVAGQRVLLARADRGRELLRDELASVAQVEQIAVYSQIDCVDSNSKVHLAISRGEINFITLTSANIARAVLTSLDETCQLRIRTRSVKLVSISPVTSAAIRELGYDVAVEASVYTIEGLIVALIAHREPA